MSRTDSLSPSILEILQTTDTCTVSNAVETMNLRMRDEGYVQKHLRCILPDHPPIAGYAVTGRIRTSAPPIANICYYQRPEWWEYIASLPAPKIIAISDIDRRPGSAAFFGEIHAEIARALGCVGYVSNGAVRDVPALERNRFQCLAGGICVSHAYAHLIDFGETVEIGFLKIAPGAILHADRHGVLAIPHEALEGLPAALKTIERRESDLIGLCRSPDFSLEKLKRALGKDDLCPRRHLP